MHKAVEVLRKHYIPVNSYIAAIQYINAREPEGVSHSVYENRIKELVGKEMKVPEKYARYTYLYLVQEIVRASFNTDQLDMDALYSLSFDLAYAFVEKNAYVFAERKTPVKLDSKGQLKKKKGWKKDEAERLFKENKGIAKKDFIELLIKDLDMTKAGAQTYWYNCNKK